MCKFGVCTFFPVENFNCLTLCICILGLVFIFSSFIFCLRIGLDCERCKDALNFSYCCILSTRDSSPFYSSDMQKFCSILFDKRITQEKSYTCIMVEDTICFCINVAANLSQIGSRLTVVLKVIEKVIGSHAA